MEYNNNLPIYLQIIDHIKTSIATGKILPGDKLPSTRQLALDYNVNPNTASRVYKEMEAQEMVYTKRGMGTYVNDSPEIVEQMKSQLAGRLLEEFIDGMVKLGYKEREIIECVSSKLSSEVL